MIIEIGVRMSDTAAVWKQRLDRHIADSTDPSDNARFDERQAAHTAPSRSRDHSRHPYQT
jgi:hypothetical protein